MGRNVSNVDVNNLYETTQTRNITMRNLINSIKLTMKRRAVYKNTVETLGRLSDRELRDIGLHRGIIPSVAYEMMMKEH